MDASVSEKQLAGSMVAVEKLSLTDAEQREKTKRIEEACHRNRFGTLVELAASTGGLLTDHLRRKAWPILLGFHSEERTAADQKQTIRADWRTLSQHRDENQVQLDVDRAFVYYPKDQSEQSLETKKTELSELIVSNLRTHPVLSYFQSYHDVVQVLLLVLGKQQAMLAVPRISLLRLRDYMLPTIEPARRHFELVSVIVKAADPELANHIAQAQNIFALSATHSLFAHDIYNYGDISRLYDFLLAHEPIMSIYLFAAVTISRRSELLEMPPDEPDMLTFVISKLPQTFDIDARIQDALSLFAKHPPQTLPGFVWWRLSQYSVLKTSRRISQPQSLEEAEILCHKQVQQLHRQESMRKNALLVYKYRKPATSLAVMLMVGALAVWLRRSGHDSLLWSMMSISRSYLPRQR
ncbi:GTPase-activating protein gyp8 [Cladophialophora chaetospira]|uniref:GTPase-activating protein gyp8 n=1 Tax=Cladophialophora chaetospira TaxID=386627 RepID=A0AA39CGK3_9EURO|nr:GTPase-activating protein gyp8 [Cladophialophora chaetospira]